MDLPERTSAVRVLDQPTRARIFQHLCDRKRPTTVEELAGEFELHPNAVRAHLKRLAAEGLLARNRVPRGPGRPPDLWSVAPDARPGERKPTGYGDLAEWLSELVGRSEKTVHAAAAVGKRIGAEIAPEGVEAGVEAGESALAALGFQPEHRTGFDGTVTYRYGNCPYRRAAGANGPVVCGLCGGLVEGLLEGIAPEAELVGFVPKDPNRAGCTVEIKGLAESAGRNGGGNARPPPSAPVS
jgi:predicted ArsR family transcriptional regulator